METPAKRQVELVSLALVLGCVAIACVRVLSFGFVNWDDPLHLVENPFVVAPSSRALLDHLRTPDLGYPIPLTVLSYRLEHALFGFGHPGGFHLTNLVLHLVAVALTHSLARRLGLGVLASAFAALVFGLHPAVAEPVAWVSGRKDVLALALSLASLRAALEPGSRARAFSLVTFALALASKPVAVWVAPMVFVVALARSDDAARTPRWREAARIALPYAVLAATCVALSMVGQARVGAIDARVSSSGTLRAAWYALGLHTRIALLLIEPCAKYLPPRWPAPFTPSVDLAPLALVPLLVVPQVLPEAPRRVARFGLILAALAYLPNSDLVPLTRFAADVYVHPALVGLALVVAAVFDSGMARIRATTCIAAAVVVVASLGLALRLVPSLDRFRDDVSLWGHTYSHNPWDYRLCQNFAMAHYGSEGAAGVLRETDACIARFGPAHFEKNRAIALFRLRRYPEAAAAFAGALRSRPDDAVLHHYARELARLGHPLPEGDSGP